jgi:DnaJ-class molecular chaperone
MIQLKATCLRCGGTGYLLQQGEGDPHHNIPCPDCEGKGVLIFDDRNGDISLEQVPPFTSEEEAIGVV